MANGPGEQGEWMRFCAVRDRARLDHSTPTGAAGGDPDETPESSEDAQGRERELHYREPSFLLNGLNGEGQLYGKTSADFRAKLIQQTELAQKYLARGGGVVTGMTRGMRDMSRNPNGGGAYV